VGFLIEVPTSFSSSEKLAKKKANGPYREGPAKRNRAGSPDFLWLILKLKNWEWLHSKAQKSSKLRHGFFFL